MAFVTYTLTDPDRFIVDPLEEDLETSLDEASAFKAGLVAAWRLFKMPGSEPSHAVDYLCFDLSQPAEHRIESNGNRLVFRVRPIGVPSMVKADAPDIDPLPNLALGPASSQPTLAPTVWNLDGVLEYGLSRYRPVRVAKEEVTLAQMKVREARRALYPAATLRTSWTQGTASQVNFTETSSGLQLEQPVFYSGRLRETYRQSLVNLQVAEKRQGKVKADFAQEIAQAYYQLIGAKSSLAAQEGLLSEARAFLQKARERFDKGLLTRLEVLNVEAQVNQAQFQRVSAESDLVLARLKFLQRLYLDSQAIVEVPDNFVQEPARTIDLEEALRLATRYRPDIQLNSLLVEFHELEEQIAKDKGGLKVDLSGFIGASGAAFETETLGLGEDYFVGIKATRNWGPDQATLSATKTKTAPRLGQSSVTDSTVYSGEYGILSQLQGLSEVQQARVGLEKARADLEEVKGTVYQEVQEAYISFTKARLQLDYAKQKIDFRQEQLKIIQTQASVNEALPSQVLEALLRLTDERTAELQARTNYYVALAKLNKAIGLPGYYR